MLNNDPNQSLVFHNGACQRHGLMARIAPMHIGAKLCALTEHGCPSADWEQCPPFPNPSGYA